jgi:hypothetical protein
MSGFAVGASAWLPLCPWSDRLSQANICAACRVLFFARIAPAILQYLYRPMVPAASASIQRRQLRVSHQRPKRSNLLSMGRRSILLHAGRLGAPAMSVCQSPLSHRIALFLTLRNIANENHLFYEGLSSVQ